MKKIICIILVIATALSVPINALAIETQDLKTIADTIIEKSTGDSVITYKNIDEFVNAADSLDINNLELAEFIMNYTGQDCTALSENDILECLGFQEISVTDEYIKVSEEGEIEYISEKEAEFQILQEQLNEKTRATWTSSNGYMKITTTYSLNKTVSNKKYYVITATAKWLKMPVCFFEDVLTIGHTGTYDSSYTGSGYLSQTLSCCTSNKSYYDSATNAANGDNVEFEYPTTSTAAIRFNLMGTSAYQCSNTISSHSKAITAISAQIKYRIIVNTGSSVNIQGAYCHKQIAVGSISISITSGSVGFSLAGSKKDYKAEPITINA